VKGEGGARDGSDAAIERILHRYAELEPKMICSVIPELAEPDHGTRSASEAYIRDPGSVVLSPWLPVLSVVRRIASAIRLR